MARGREPHEGSCVGIESHHVGGRGVERSREEKVSVERESQDHVGRRVAVDVGRGETVENHAVVGVDLDDRVEKSRDEEPPGAAGQSPDDPGKEEAPDGSSKLSEKRRPGETEASASVAPNVPGEGTGKGPAVRAPVVGSNS
jgi:hypothetical protein